MTTAPSRRRRRRAGGSAKPAATAAFAAPEEGRAAIGAVGRRDISEDLDRIMDVTVHRIRRLRGTLRVPGDKSISHRALILGALSEGTQSVKGVPKSGDVKSTIACLRGLGATVAFEPDGGVKISRGTGQATHAIYAGNSGTTARLMSGLIAGRGFDCTIDGDASLRRRPMERVAEPLRLMGAEVRPAPGGCLPMRITGGRLKGIEYRPSAASAQVKSAVLIAGLFAEGETTVVERTQTRDHTERMLLAMGADLRTTKGAPGGPDRDAAISVTVPGGSKLTPLELDVPGDVSSAMFLACAAAIVPDSEIRLPRTGVNPTRAGAIEVMRSMGADVELENPSVVCGEEVADVVVRSSGLAGVEIGGGIVPSLIDELPVLAVLATQAQGRTVVTGARELRYKESDRIRAIVSTLSTLGARIEELDDGFAVEGPCPLRGGIVPSYGDHRIAMAMAVAGLVSERGVKIEDGSVSAVSYPGFFHDLRRLAD